MKITKLGHCCLLIEESGVRILTDPGAWTTAQSEVKDLDVVLISHEHTDHFHLDSLKIVLKNNPKVKIFTNSAVGKLLGAEKIDHEILEHGQHTQASGVLIEGFGEKHAVIYEQFGQVKNTGYFIANRLFYPGDAFYDPGKAVEILALPACGPWMKISEAVEYAKEVKPKKAFPVHDGMLQIFTGYHFVPEMVLPKIGIEFFIPKLGQEFIL